MSELVPIYEPNMPWKAWNIKGIYDGTVTGGRYCPKVDDAVWDWDQGLFRVIAVDESTGFWFGTRFGGCGRTKTVRSCLISFLTDLGSFAY